MQYYSLYGHRDFVLCLGYKANIIKGYFLNYRPSAGSDSVISEFGSKIEILGEATGLAWLILECGATLANVSSRSGMESATGSLSREL